MKKGRFTLPGESGMEKEIAQLVNLWGAAAIAGSTAGGNIEGFMYAFMNAFYQAVLTSVSQNYGAGEKKIYKSIYISILCVIVVGAVLGALCIIFAKPLLGIYITDSPQALEMGIKRMTSMCVVYFFVGVMEVLTGALRGLGYSTITAVNSLLGGCGFRIFWIIVLLPLHRSIEFLFFCLPISWFVVSIMHFVTLLMVKPRISTLLKT